MSFINSYKPAPIILPADDEPYDLNCNVHVPQALETERVKLVPFIPANHAAAFYAPYHADPSLDRHFPLDFPTYEAFLTGFELYFRSDPSTVIFAILDKTKPNYDENIEDSMTGMIGLFRCSPSHRSAEIGPVIILPKYRRTFVSSNAIGLLMHYLLDKPTEGGLGFRRVAWTTHPDNESSVRAAERLGFKREGLLRWTWVLKPGKEGIEMTGQERGEGYGRHSLLLSVCWEEWENGVQHLVTNTMNRLR